MDQDNCTHIDKIDLERFGSLLDASNSLPLVCSDCHEEHKAHSKDETEVVYICLDCLHVGCVGESKGHARIHFERFAGHNFAIKPNGELFCYLCTCEVSPITTTEKKKIAELQKLLRKFFERITPEEEKLGNERIIVSGDESSLKGDIDKINQKLYKEIVTKAKQYPNMCGLSNLGNTCKAPFNFLGYFNSMSQCFQATVPLVDYFHNLTGDYLDNDYIKRFKAFTEQYHRSSGSINPSSVFSIISSQKKHFGNFSQQDSYDAFLTMLETLIREQKKVLKKNEGIKDELNKILDSRVPVGEIFSFSLISRGKLNKKPTSDMSR